MALGIKDPQHSQVLKRHDCNLLTRRQPSPLADGLIHCALQLCADWVVWKRPRRGAHKVVDQRHSVPSQDRLQSVLCNTATGDLGEQAARKQR